MKRKPVKPISKDLENQIKDAVSPAKRNVGNYESNLVKSRTSQDVKISVDAKNFKEVSDEVERLNNVIAQRDSKIERLDDKIMHQEGLLSQANKDVLTQNTTIAQLREALALKDGELEVAKEQMELLEDENLPLKVTISVLKEENLDFKKAYNKEIDKVIGLTYDIDVIKQKWYYRWFS